MKTKFTKKELILIIHKLKEKLGKIPKIKDLEKDLNFPSLCPFRREFGTWNNALEYAGFPLNKKHVYTEKDLILILQKLNRKLKRTLKLSDCVPPLPSSETFKNHFGSWNNALHQAKISTKYKVYTKKELIDILHQLAQKEGKLPTSNLLNKDRDLPMSKTFVFHFGSWDEAILAYQLSLTELIQFKNRNYPAICLKCGKKYTHDEIVEYFITDTCIQPNCLGNLKY